MQGYLKHNTPNNGIPESKIYAILTLIFALYMGLY